MNRPKIYNDIKALLDQWKELKKYIFSEEEYTEILTALEDPEADLEWLKGVVELKIFVGNKEKGRLVGEVAAKVDEIGPYKKTGQSLAELQKVRKVVEEEFDFYDKANRSILDESIVRTYYNRPFGGIGLRSYILVLVAVRGQEEWLPILHEVGADPNVTGIFGNTPLIWAVANGCFSFAHSFIRLFKDKVDYKAKGLNNTAPFLIIAKGYEDITGDGKKFDKKHCAFNLIKAISEVVAPEEFADIINIKCRAGNTALHIACLRRDLKMVDFLLKKGADVNIKNDADKIPLDMLGCTYEQACNTLDMVAAFFPLDKEQYHKSDVAKIKKLLQEKVQSLPTEEEGCNVNNQNNLSAVVLLDQHPARQDQASHLNVARKSEVDIQGASQNNLPETIPGQPPARQDPVSCLNPAGSPGRGRTPRIDQQSSAPAIDAAPNAEISVNQKSRQCPYSVRVCMIVGAILTVVPIVIMTITSYIREGKAFSLVKNFLAKDPEPQVMPEIRALRDGNKPSPDTDGLVNNDHKSVLDKKTTNDDPGFTSLVRN